MSEEKKYYTGKFVGVSGNFAMILGLIGGLFGVILFFMGFLFLIIISNKPQDFESIHRLLAIAMMIFDFSLVIASIFTYLYGKTLNYHEDDEFKITKKSLYFLLDAILYLIIGVVLMMWFTNTKSSIILPIISIILFVIAVGFIVNYALLQYINEKYLKE